MARGGGGGVALCAGSKYFPVYNFSLAAVSCFPAHDSTLHCGLTKNARGASCVVRRGRCNRVREGPSYEYTRPCDSQPIALVA